MTTERSRYGIETQASATIGQWLTSIAIILLLLGVGMMFGYAWRAYHETPEPRRVVLQLTPAEKSYFVARYKHHNIWGSECEGTRCRFWRDGQWCKL
jgi:hypothetical protein